MAGRDPREGKYVDTGHVLSKYDGWQDAKSNPALWFLILFFNAFFTTIGVGIRDLCNGECMLTKEHPFGTLNCANREAFYICTVVICGSSLIIMAVVNFLHQLWRAVSNRPENLGKCKSASCSFIQHFLINFFIVASGTLYIAADNYFFLVDPVDGEPNGSHIRSFLAGSSLVCTACVFAINQWFKKVNCNIGTKSEETYCYEECRQFRENSASKICRHGRDHKDCNHTSGECIHKYENGICTIHCCTPHYFGDRGKICKHGRDHAKCRIECDYVNDELKKNKNKEYWKFVIFWYPMPIIIATFDSIFLSVVDEVSDENNRKGFDCENNMHGSIGGLIFYIFISVLMWISIIGITVVRCWNMCTYICQVDKTASSKKCKCLIIITYSVIMCCTFIAVGTAFTAVDNNWPWICFAKFSNEICSWVKTRIGLLAFLTVIIFCFTKVIFIVTLGLWCLDCSAKPGGEPESGLGAEPDSRTGGERNSRTDGKPDSITEGKPDSRTDGKPDSRTDGKPDSRTDGKPDSRTDGKPDSRTEGKPDSRTEGKPDSRTDGKPDSRTDGKPDSRTDGKPDSRTDGKPDSRTDGKPDSRTDGKPDSRTDGKSDSRTDGKPDSRTDGKSDSRTEGKPDSRTDGKPDSRTDGKPYSRTEGKPDSRTDGKPDSFQKYDDTSHSTESDNVIAMKLLHKSECKPETVTEDASECRK